MNPLAPAVDRLLSLRIDPSVWTRLTKRAPEFAQKVDSRNSLQEVPLISAYRTVVVDYDAISPEDRAKLEKLAMVARRTEFVVISSGKFPEDLRRLIGHRAVSHVLAKRYGEVDEVDLSVTARKLAAKGIFGLEAYLEWGADSNCLKLTNTSEQQRALDHVQAFTRERKIHPRLAMLFTDAGDELLTNAFRHGGDKGAVELRCGFNGRALGLSVSDMGGKLSKDRALSMLAAAWPGANNEGSARCLGLTKVLASVSQLDVNIVEGVRTEFVALLDVWGSYRDFAQAVKSFNLYERNA